MTIMILVMIKCGVVIVSKTRYLCLRGGFRQAVKSVDKNSKKSTETLDLCYANTDFSKHEVVIVIKSVTVSV